MIANSMKITFHERPDGHYYECDNKIYPSVTTILKAYPKHDEFLYWLARQGPEKAKQIVQNAGDVGHRVHKGIEAYIRGYPDSQKYTVAEKILLHGFHCWYETVEPKVLHIEHRFVLTTDGYAGTIDLICIIDKILYVVDYKTSNLLSKQYWLQVNAYAWGYADWERDSSAIIPRLGLLHLSRDYPLNYKWETRNSTISDMQMFLKIKDIWHFSQETPHEVSMAKVR